jgi:hypothetical protein
MTVLLERTLDDITLQGEIEGLPFDKNKRRRLKLTGRTHRYYSMM